MKLPFGVHLLLSTDRGQYRDNDASCHMMNNLKRGKCDKLPSLELISLFGGISDTKTARSSIFTGL